MSRPPRVLKAHVVRRYDVNIRISTPWGVRMEWSGGGKKPMRRWYWFRTWDQAMSFVRAAHRNVAAENCVNQEATS